MTNPTELREAIARVIDAEAWLELDTLREIDAERAQRHSAVRFTRSLAKADAIMALLPHSPPAGSALEALRELSEKATPGEWQVISSVEPGNRHVLIVRDPHDTYPVADTDFSNGGNNADLIVAAVNFVRDLLSQPPQEDEK